MLPSSPPRDPWTAILFHNVVPATEEARRGRAFLLLEQETGFLAERIAGVGDVKMRAICGTTASSDVQIDALRVCAACFSEVGDPRDLVRLPFDEAMASLQRFPGIHPAMAAHLLLLAGHHSRLAFDFFALRTIVRIGYGLDENAGNYGQHLDSFVQHESAVAAAELELDEGDDLRIDATLRLRQLGIDLCTKRPQCARCPIRNQCDLPRLIGKNR